LLFVTIMELMTLAPTVGEHSPNPGYNGNSG